MNTSPFRNRPLKPVSPTQEAAAAAAAAEAADVEKKRQDEEKLRVSLRWSWLGVFFMYTPRKMNMEIPK